MSAYRCAGLKPLQGTWPGRVLTTRQSNQQLIDSLAGWPAGAIAAFPVRSAAPFSDGRATGWEAQAIKAAQVPASRVRRALHVVNVATLETPPKEILPEVDGKIKIGINGESGGAIGKVCCWCRHARVTGWYWPPSV